MNDRLTFTDDEIEEARRLNRRLDWMPRFRARLPWDRVLVQSMLYATQAVTPSAGRNVSVGSRRVEWQGVKANLRVLRPEGPSKGIYIDFHGGGWAVGNARMDDLVNGRMAEKCGLTVVSVDYDLVPRQSVQDMIRQCAAAASWVFEHAEAEFGASDIFIGGESAGAHLAACTTLAMRDSRADFDRMKGAVLFYGAFDLAGTESALQAGSDTLVLHGPSMRSGLQKLTPGMSDAERRSPELSPLYADLSGLPPALILVGTLDPLIDDSRILAERWQAASGNAELVVAPEAPHAFNRLPSKMARRTNAYVRHWIGERLETSGNAAAAE